MLTGSGDGLVEEHEANLAGEFCGEGFLKVRGVAVTGGGVVWIGVVIGIAEWIGEEVYDAVHPDVEGAGSVVGGDGEGCREERDAGGGGDVGCKGLLLGGAAGRAGLGLGR